MSTLRFCATSLALLMWLFSSNAQAKYHVMVEGTDFDVEVNFTAHETVVIEYDTDKNPIIEIVDEADLTDDLFDESQSSIKVDLGRKARTPWILAVPAYTAGVASQATLLGVCNGFAKKLCLRRVQTPNP